MALRSKFEMGVRALTAAAVLVGASALSGCGSDKQEAAPKLVGAGWTFAARCPDETTLQAFYIESFNEPGEVKFMMNCIRRNGDTSMPEDPMMAEGPGVESQDIPTDFQAVTLQAAYEFDVEKSAETRNLSNIFLVPKPQSVEVRLFDTMLTGYQFAGEPFVDHFAVG